MIEIKTVTTPSHIQAIKELFREYEQFLQVDLCFQHFEEELTSLPGHYAPPHGNLLLALKEHQAAGCVAMRYQDEGICEMKRLYVRPAYAGLGLGEKLALKIMEYAKAAGYARMRLDTLEKLRPALRLYARLGFRTCPAYYNNPLAGVIFMERSLTP